MPRLIRVSETQWGGMASAPREGDVPPGKTRLALNVIVQPGSPGSLVPRRGIEIQDERDFLAAPVWVTGTVYVVDQDIVFAQGQTWICRVGHTAGTFLTDLGAATPKWEVLAVTGIHATNNPHTPGSIIRVMDSGGFTLHCRAFHTRKLRSYPFGFVAPVAILPEGDPTGNGPAVHAYIAAHSSASGTPHRLIQVDINPNSGVAAASRLTATQVLTAQPSGTTEDDFHNFWIQKGPDNTCYFLAWKSNRGLSPNGSVTAAERDWFGTWDGTSLDENSFDAGRDNTGTIAGDANLVHPEGGPRFLSLSKGGDKLYLIGEEWGGNRSDLDPRFDQQEKRWKTDDILWELNVGLLPDNLLVRDAWKTILRGPGFSDDNLFIPAFRPWWDPTVGQSVPDSGIKKWYPAQGAQLKNSGDPVLFTLPDGQLLLSTTRSTLDGGNTQLQVIGDINLDNFRLQAVRHEVSVSDEPSVSGDDYGRNRSTTNRVCLLDRGRVCVARGTEGFSIVEMFTGAGIDPRGTERSFSIATTTVAGVAASPRNRIIALADSQGGSGADTFRIQLRDYNGADLGITYTNTEYTNFQSTSGSDPTEFRGMFFDENEDFLWVLLYDQNASAGSRLFLAGVAVGIETWATSTLYFPGKLLVEGTDRELHKVLREHTSGTLADDITASKIAALPSTYTINIAANTALEPNAWAYLDSAGAQHRNIVNERTDFG